MPTPATLTGYLTGAMDPDEAVVLEAQAAGGPDLQAQIDTQREAGPRRGPAPKLLRVACPTCGAVVNAYCRSSTGKRLSNGHRARRDVANMDLALSGPGPYARPQTDSADELVSAIKRAARAGRGIRLSGAECKILAGRAWTAERIYVTAWAADPEACAAWRAAEATPSPPPTSPE